MSMRRLARAEVRAYLLHPTPGHSPKKPMPIVAIGLGALLGYLVFIAGVTGAAEGPKQDSAKSSAVKEAALVVAGRTVAVFRASFEGLSPADRVSAALARLQSLPAGDESSGIKIEDATIGKAAAVAVTVGDRVVFFLASGDLEPAANDSLRDAAQQAAENLKQALQAKGAAEREFGLLGSITRAGVATFLLLLTVWFLRRVSGWGAAKLGASKVLTRRIPPVLATGLQAHILRASQVLIRLMLAATVLVLGYLWLVYALEQFPYTAQWGERLGTFLVQLLLEFGGGALGAVPGLFVVLIIILIARWCVRIVSLIFKEIQSGTISFPGLERETARTTQTLLIFAIWLFALVVAYPYIPGSETEAFKGLSVLVGLMVTLGSTGLINQVISGLFVIYSRSVRPQDYVRIGDIEGEVMSIGSLAIKLRTPRQEEITIPHSVLVAAATINFSRLAGSDGMVITGSVTIGYNIPWRQVHALLFLAASRTRGVRKEPPPRVLQRELSDHFVQYQLLAHLEEGANRAEAISELHAQTQDAFNEYGVQMMAPSFESQPEKAVLVPKSEWYAAPARKPEQSDEIDGQKS